MKNDRKKVDVFFTSSLEGHKTEPSEQVWQNVEKLYFRRKAGLMGNFLKVLPFLLIVSSGIIAFTVLIKPDAVDPALFDQETGVIKETTSPQEETGQTAADIEPEALTTKEYAMLSDQLNETGELVQKDQAERVISAIIQQPAHAPAYETKRDEIGVYPSIACKYIAPADQFGLSTFELEDDMHKTLYTATLGLPLKDDYLRKPEYWFGAHINPSVMFYPGKNNKNSWSGDLTIDFMLSRFTLQTGSGLGYYEESGAYQVSYTSFDSVGYYLDITSFSVNPQYPDSVFFEFSEASIYDSVNHIVLDEIQNKYLYLRFPLNVGYNVFNSKRLSCYVRGGVVFSLLLWKEEPEMRLPASDMKLISIEQEYPGRNNTSWQLTAGINLVYHISRRVGLSIEPNYMRYFGKLYKPGFNYSDTRPYGIGLKAGIYVKL